MDTFRLVPRSAFRANRQLVAHDTCLHTEACILFRWPLVFPFSNLTRNFAGHAVCCATRNARRDSALTENPHEQWSGHGSHDDSSSQRNTPDSLIVDGQIGSFPTNDPAQNSDLESLEIKVGRSSRRRLQDGNEGRVRVRSKRTVAIPATTFPHRRQLQSGTNPDLKQQCDLDSFRTAADRAPESAIDSANKQKQKKLTEKERTSENQKGKGKRTTKELQQELTAQQFQEQKQAVEQRPQPMHQQQQARKRQHDHVQPQQEQEHENGDLKEEPNEGEKERKSKRGEKLQQQHKRQPHQDKQPQDQVLPAPDTPPVYVMWDLDNKYPLHLDHQHLVDNIRSELRPYGKVMDISAFCNFHTLNYVPELWAEAREMGMEHPLEALQPEELRCPLCSRRFLDTTKLKRHFKELHEREHNKKFAHAPTAKKYLQSAKLLRFKEARNVAFYKKRGFDLEGILRAAGVRVTPVPMGPQTADTALEKEAMKLLTSVQVPVAGSSAGRQPVLCVVSDDHGFEDILKLFKQRGWRAVVMSCSSFKNADVRIDWDNVAG